MTRCPLQSPDITRHFVRSPDDTEAHWDEDGCPLRDPNAACTFSPSSPVSADTLSPRSWKTSLAAQTLALADSIDVTSIPGSKWRGCSTGTPSPTIHSPRVFWRPINRRCDCVWRDRLSSIKNGCQPPKRGLDATTPDASLRDFHADPPASNAIHRRFTVERVENQHCYKVALVMLR